MANHKKHRNVSARGHCKMCKHWKINGMCRDNPDFEKYSDHKRRMCAKQDIELTWDEAVEIILEERKEAWQKLADLDSGKITLKDIKEK